MDRLEAMTLFVTAVDGGSLAAAARHHGRSPATITRAIALLEHQAGETLLLRSTRRLGLTAAGERHLAVWRTVLSMLRGVGPSAQAGPLQGSLVLTAPELFGRLAVMPLVEAFLREHPRMAVRVLLVNRIVDLVGEGVDLAIRLAPLPDSTLSATGLGTVRTMLCASPAYLARAGVPDTPRALGQHDCIGLNADADGEAWQFRADPGCATRIRAVRVRTRLGVNSAAAGVDAALRGHGIVRARGYQVADAFASGRLVSLLPEYEPPPVPATLVFQPERARRGALRVFLDQAVPRLRATLASPETR